MKRRRKAKEIDRSSTEPWHASISAEKTALNEKRTKARLVMCHCMYGELRESRSAFLHAERELEISLYEEDCL